MELTSVVRPLLRPSLMEPALVGVALMKSASMWARWQAPARRDQ